MARHIFQDLNQKRFVRNVRKLPVNLPQSGFYPLNGRRFGLSQLEKDLMRMSFKQLSQRFGQQVPGWLRKEVDQLLQESRKRGISFAAKTWVSTEWFSPSGIRGFAIPFFLLNPALRIIESKVMGAVEGEKKSDRMKILSHELGHVLDHSLRSNWRKRKDLVFGISDQPYPRYCVPMPSNKFFVGNLPFGYGQLHPDEDFAESFAYWLHHPNWHKSHGSEAFACKLAFFDDLSMCPDALIRSHQPRSELGSLVSNYRTLGEHYGRRLRIERILEKQKLLKTVCRPLLKTCRLSEVEDSSSKDIPGLKFVREQKTHKPIGKSPIKRVWVPVSLSPSTMASAVELSGIPMYWMKFLVRDYKAIARTLGWEMTSPKKIDSNSPLLLAELGRSYFKLRLNRVML